MLQKDQAGPVDAIVRYNCGIFDCCRVSAIYTAAPLQGSGHDYILG